MGVLIVTLGLLIFENNSYSQNILGLKVAPKSERGMVGEGRNNVPNELKQPNNAGVKMFGSTPVFGYEKMQLFAQD